MAFVAPTALPRAFPASAVSPLCPAAAKPTSPPAVAAGVTMRCRRDLKKEKRLRNLEFARSHRKRPVKFFNRRSAQEAVTNEDNDFLSSIYDTIRFKDE